MAPVRQAEDSMGFHLLIVACYTVTLLPPVRPSQTVQRTAPVTPLYPPSQRGGGHGHLLEVNCYTPIIAHDGRLLDDIPYMNYI